MNTFEFTDVEYRYGSSRAWKVTRSFSGGNVYQLIGENGSGKSTLGKMFTGIETYSGGHAYINGRSVVSMSNNEKRDTFQYISQEPHWSFIGESFCHNLQYFGIRDSVCINGGMFDQENDFQRRLASIANRSVFGLSSEDIFLLAIQESRIWPRPVLFIDECPDFDGNLARDFFVGAIQSRVNANLITIIARHIPMNIEKIQLESIEVKWFICQ